MASDDRSVIEFGYYHEGLQRFEHFVVGISALSVLGLIGLANYLREP